MIKFLPILSESLRGILTNLKNDYPEDQIVKEILRVDKIMEFYLSNKDNVPEIVPVFEEELVKSLLAQIDILEKEGEANA